MPMSHIGHFHGLSAGYPHELRGSTDGANIYYTVNLSTILNLRHIIQNVKSNN